MKIIIPLLLTAGLACPGLLWSQTSFRQPTTGDATVNLNKGTYRYYDSGGPDTSYANLESGTITFCATQPDEVVRVVFISVAVEVNTGNCKDVLQVSGDDDAKNGDYCGVTNVGPSPPGLFLKTGTSFKSAPGECLTFTFESDETAIFDGWTAIIDVQEPGVCVNELECGEQLVCENFESYVPWFLTPQAPQWETAGLGAGDGEVTDDVASEGEQSLLIESINNTNLSLPLGTHSSGRFRLSWDIRVEPMSQGQYGVYYTEALNQQAFQVKLGEGIGRLFVPNDQTASLTSFPYTPGSWNHFVHLIDLEKDSAELWVNGQFVTRWLYSLGSSSGGGIPVRQLGAARFSSQLFYFLDNVSVTKTGCAMPACQNETEPCPVRVNGKRYASQCLACCAGYTFGEWEEEEGDPEITGFNPNREWKDVDNEINLMMGQSDTMLFVEIGAIDTLDFRPEDVLLSNNCSPAVSVTVEDQRPESTDEACYNFNVIWRVAVDSVQTDSLILPVFVECKQRPSIDMLIYLGQDTLLPGDTLRLANCPMPDSADFTLIKSSCAPNIDLRFQRLNFRWIGTIPADQRTDSTPCFSERLIFTPSQCDIPGTAFNVYVEVRDLTRPGLTPPADTTIACVSELNDLDETGRIRLAADSCGIADTLYTDDLSQLQECTGIVLRTWTVIDSCGNRMSAVQRIRVRDRIPPTFTIPGTATIQGLSDLDSLRLTGNVSNVRDNCGIADTSYTDDLSGMRGCTGEVRRTWRIVDVCGNSTSNVQIINVQDREAPRFTVPADRTVNCLEELQDTSLTGIITGVTDNVGIADTAFTDDLSGLSGCAGMVIRTWTVTDSCGNSATASQRLMVRDEIAPTFVAPFAVTLACFEELGNPAKTGQVLFVNDNCGILDTTFRDSIVQVSDCIYQVFRFWTVRDRCSNATTRMQRITVADTEGPEFRSPPQVRVRQQDMTNLGITGMVRNVRDNCSIGDTTYTDVFVRRATCSMEGWVVRTWRVTDWCGNFNETSQDIFYTVDPPVADAGPDKVVTCQQPMVQLDGTGSTLGDRFTYRWVTDTGNIASGDRSPVPQVNAPGTYTLTVRDTISGCEATDLVVVTRQSDLRPAVAARTDVQCHGASSGAITIANTGGNPPYRIRWSTGDTTLSIRNLAVGVYAVTVTDAGNCSATLSVNIQEPAVLGGTVTVLQGSRCDDSGSGRATAAATGGVAPYRFVWDNGETTAAATRLRPGAHVVTIFDNNGCSTTRSTIIQQDRPDATLIPLPDQCENGTPLTLAGGAPSGGVYSGRGVTNGRFDPALAGVGSHIIRYIYSAPNGCSDTAQVVVKVSTLPVLTDKGLAPLCASSNPVRLNFIEPAGGTYRGTGISDNNLMAPRTSGAGNFPVLYTYRDSVTGCSNSLAALLTVQPAQTVTLDIMVSDTVFCAGEIVEIRAKVVNGGSVPSFNWNLNGVSQPLNADVLRVKVPAAGRYSVNGSVSSNLACVTARTVADTVTIRVVNPTIMVKAPAIDTVCNDLDRLRLSGGTPAGGAFSGAFVDQGFFLVEDAGVGGPYPVIYSLRDPAVGCLVSDTFAILVDVCTDAAAPEALQFLQVYPNPASGFVNVAFSAESAEPVLLQLWDGYGRPVRQRQVEWTGSRWTERIDVQGLPPGIYWLSAAGQQARVWRKVIIQ